MALSEDQIGQFIVEARLSNIDLDSRVVVGEDVGTAPSQASGSWNPADDQTGLGLELPHLVVEEALQFLDLGGLELGTFIWRHMTSR